MKKNRSDNKNNEELSEEELAGISGGAGYKISVGDYGTFTNAADLVNAANDATATGAGSYSQELIDSNSATFAAAADRFNLAAATQESKERIYYSKQKNGGYSFRVGTAKSRWGLFWK